VIGASGVGKSVLIKQLIGLLRPDTGEIWLDGEEVMAIAHLWIAVEVLMKVA